MCSGKTARLLALSRATAHLQQRRVVVKCAVDGREAGRELVSRTGDKLQADLCVSSLQQLQVADSTLYVLDEVQFYAEGELLRFWQACARSRGTSLFVAGLDLDFAGRPFGATLQLAEAARKLQQSSSSSSSSAEQGTGLAQHMLARCCHRSQEQCSAGSAPCSAPAAFSQRLTAGGTERVLVGGAEFYRPACERHHSVEPICGQAWAAEA